MLPLWEQKFIRKYVLKFILFKPQRAQRTRKVMQGGRETDSNQELISGMVKWCVKGINRKERKGYAKDVEKLFVR